MNVAPATKRTLQITAWAAMLIVSDLPDMLITWLGGSIPAWMFWAKAGCLALFLGLTLLWKAIRPLWQYAVVLLVLFLALATTSLVRARPGSRAISTTRECPSSPATWRSWCSTSSWPWWCSPPCG